MDDAAPTTFAVDGASPAAVHLVLDDELEQRDALSREWRGRGGAVHVVGAESFDSWIESITRLARRLIAADVAGIVVVLRRGRGNLGAMRRLLDSGCHDVLSEHDADLNRTLDHARAALLLRAERARRLEAGGLAGRSIAMRRVRATLAAAVEDPHLPVLLLGETGTGKFAAAKALHSADPTRSAHPFHGLDCGAVTGTLFGSELFGHVRGAFTGAVGSRPGALVTAGSGTLLLDEVGELPPELQAGFLTALQERRFRAVGSDSEQSIQCRIVSATNQDLPARVAQRRFRADLFFRLDGLRVELPALRERPEDVPDLFRVLVRRACGEDVEIDADVYASLATCSFPGNIRQLDTIARRATRAAAGGRIRVPHVDLPPRREALATTADPDSAIAHLVRSGMTLDQIVARSSAAAVAAALELVAEGAVDLSRTELVRRVAGRLEVSERTVYNRIRDRANGGEHVADG